MALTDPPRPSRGNTVQARLDAALRALSQAIGQPVHDTSITSPGVWKRCAVTGSPEAGQPLQVLASAKSAALLALAVESLVAGHRLAQDGPGALLPPGSAPAP